MTMEERKKRETLLGNIRMAKQIIERSEKELEELDKKQKEKEEKDKEHMARVFNVKMGKTVCGKEAEKVKAEYNAESVFGKPLNDQNKEIIKRAENDIYTENLIM